MRKNNIKTIIEKSESLSIEAENLLNSLSHFEDINSHPFDVKKPIRGTDSSVSQIVSRIHSAGGIITEFDKATRPNLAPLSVLVNLQKSLEETEEAILTIINRIENIKNSQGGLQSFDYSSFHALARNGNNNNMQGEFKTLHNTCELLLQRFFESLFILKPRASYSFQAAANALSTVIDDTNDQISTLKQSIKQVSVSKSKITEIETNAETQFAEITRLKNDGDNDRKTISEYLAQATQEKASIHAISTEAENLQTSVESYQNIFNQFKKQIDEREEKFSTGTAKLEELISSFDKQREDVARLIERSEQMLSSATVAGLASNFSNIKNELTSELRWARGAFYVGIVFLMISALPLLAFVTLPIISPILTAIFPNLLLSAADFAITPADSGWKYFGQVLSRVAILLPAAWLVSFAAIRHSSLFRLREHYAYKYSMAVAVEGFKQQAPQYAEEIAALVLEQLAFNPTDKLVPSKEIREGTAPGISRFLLKHIRARTESTKSAEEKQ